jgi:hypothetical protein
VRALQEKAGLPVDGIAGRQTRMVLGSWMPISPAPSLQPRPTPAEDVIAMLSEASKGAKSVGAAPAVTPPVVVEQTVIPAASDAAAPVEPPAAEADAATVESADLAPPANPEAAAPETSQAEDTTVPPSPEVDGTVEPGAPLAEIVEPGAEPADVEGEVAPAPVDAVVSPEASADSAPVAAADGEPLSKSYPDEVTAPSLGVAPLVPTGDAAEDTR